MSLQRKFSTRPLYWLDSKTSWTGDELLLYGYDTLDVVAALKAESDRNTSFNFDAYCELLPIPVEEWAPYNVGREHPLLEAPLEFHLKELLGFVEQTSYKRKNLLDFLHDLVNLKGLAESQSTLLLIDPRAAVCEAYDLLKTAWREDGRDSMMFAKALILFGLGARAFAVPIECELCYRLAIPGMSRCQFHSRAKSFRIDFEKDASAQAHRARTGRKVTKRILEKTPACDSQYPDTLPLLEQEVLVDILWGSISLDSKLQRTILAALGKAPMVKRKLPSDFLSMDFEMQIKVLKAILDPIHESASRWAEKILAAEKWFAEEKEVSPGSPPKGMRQKNRVLVEQACQLISAGVTRNDTAEQLHISANYLSKLLQRRREQNF